MSERPELMLSLSRRISAANDLLKGMGDEYITALVQGRMKQWAAAMRAIVDLLENDDKDLPRAKRDEVSR